MITAPYGLKYVCTLKKSLAKLEGVHPELVAVVKIAKQTEQCNLARPPQGVIKETEQEYSI